MVPLFDSVNIPFVQQFLDADRKLQPNEIMESAATDDAGRTGHLDLGPAPDPQPRSRHGRLRQAAAWPVRLPG